MRNERPGDVVAPGRPVSDIPVRRHGCARRARTFAFDRQVSSLRPALASRSAVGIEHVPEGGEHDVDRGRRMSVTVFLPGGCPAAEFGNGEDRVSGLSVDRLGAVRSLAHARWRPAGGEPASAPWRPLPTAPSASSAVLAIAAIAVLAGRRPGDSRSAIPCLARLVVAEHRRRTGGLVDMALSVRSLTERARGQGGRADDFGARPCTGHRTRLSRQEAAEQVNAGFLPADERLRMARELVVCRTADRWNPATEWLADRARSQAAGSLLAVADRRFVRRTAAGTPTSAKGRLTIRWGAAISGWTPDDSGAAVTRGFRPTRDNRRVGVGLRSRHMLPTIFHVTNAMAVRPHSADQRPVDRSTSCRPARGRSAADRRSPVRWLTVAE